jgi:site-specific DNA-methyltransferase (adenine-specific)
MKYQDLRNGRFYNEDTFEAMADIPDGVIDMLLVDLPYGTTDCKWDSVLPFDRLWASYNRILKPNAAMVFTASQPFTTVVMNKALEQGCYKTFWVWNKKLSGSFALAKYHPLRITEDIIVCSNGTKKLDCYNPQMRKGIMRNKRGYGKVNEIQSGLKPTPNDKFNDDYYPVNLIEIANGRLNKLHPTQKPVELFEYLIRTYSNEGEIVLDNTAGSGTTAIAAINSNRKWVCIEKDETYYGKAIERINAHVF